MLFGGGSAAAALSSDGIDLSSSARLRAHTGPSLAMLHRFMCEPSSYTHASSCSPHALLHASPSRRFNATIVSGPTTSSNSTSSSKSSVPRSLQPLSYQLEQMHLHDCFAFTSTMSRALRLPSTVYADACASIHKYCSIYPIQKQAFTLAQTDDGSALHSSSTPTTAASPASSAASDTVLSSSPPLSLYALGTACLFFTCKSHDVPRRLNDFVDAHIHIVQILQRIRRQPLNNHLTPKEKQTKKISALERMKSVWKEFHEQSHKSVEAHHSQQSATAAAATQHSTGSLATSFASSSTISSLLPAVSASSTSHGFNPLTVPFPSAASTFTPSSDWNQLRNELVYLEFLLLRTMEFEVKNSVASLEDEGLDHIVQQLVIELTEPIDAHERISPDSPQNFPSPYPSHQLSHAYAKLTWILTHACVRSSALLHSNVYIVAIAIVHLAAQPFQPPHSSTSSAITISSSDAPPLPNVDESAPMDTQASDQTLTLASSSSSAIEYLNLEAIVESRRWSPPFVVTEVDPRSTTSNLSHDARWYHTLCPSLTSATLLALCELIMESALLMPMPPSSDTEGAESDPLSDELLALSELHPWNLASSSSSASSFDWRPAPQFLARQPDEPDIPYIELYPRHAKRPPGPPLILPNDEEEEAERSERKRRRKVEKMKEEIQGSTKHDAIVLDEHANEEVKHQEPTAPAIPMRNAPTSIPVVVDSNTKSSVLLDRDRASPSRDRDRDRHKRTRQDRSPSPRSRSQHHLRDRHSSPNARDEKDRDEEYDRRKKLRESEDRDVRPADKHVQAESVAAASSRPRSSRWSANHPSSPTAKPIAQPNGHGAHSSLPPPPPPPPPPPAAASSASAAVPFSTGDARPLAPRSKWQSTAIIKPQQQQIHFAAIKSLPGAQPPSTNPTPTSASRSESPRRRPSQQEHKESSHHPVNSAHSSQSYPRQSLNDSSRDSHRPVSASDRVSSSRPVNTNAETYPVEAKRREILREPTRDLTPPRAPQHYQHPDRERARASSRDRRDHDRDRDRDHHRDVDHRARDVPHHHRDVRRSRSRSRGRYDEPRSLRDVRDVRDSNHRRPSSPPPPPPPPPFRGPPSHAASRDFAPRDTRGAGKDEFGRDLPASAHKGGERGGERHLRDEPPRDNRRYEQRNEQRGYHGKPYRR